MKRTFVGLTIWLYWNIDYHCIYFKSG